jgi:hypothetical protein
VLGDLLRNHFNLAAGRLNFALKAESVFRRAAMAVVHLGM